MNNRQGIGFVVTYPWYMGWRKQVIDKKYLMASYIKTIATTTGRTDNVPSV